MWKSRYRTGGKIGVVAVGIIVALHLCIMGCTGESKKVEQEQAKSIQVGAGAGLKPALDQIAKVFTEKTGIKVENSYLCSAMVLTNMQLTRTGDVMVPGTQHYMDLAIEKKVIDPDTVSIAGYMIPVIAVQKGNPHNITCIEDLAKSGLKVGVGELEVLAVGRLTDKMLKELGIYEDVMKNVVVKGGSAIKLMLALAMGNLDAEINFMATAKSFADKVDIIEIDPKKLKYSVAPIGMTTYTKNKAAAQKYLDLVGSKEGQAIFAKFGFEAYFDPEEIEKVK
jgi:molybdate transport system substrate-binding protein